jgi:mevalonyl-CoA ligase
VFFAVAKIGAILVILNNTYTPTEAMYGLKFSGCKVFFTTQQIGRLDNRKLLSEIERDSDRPKVFILRGEAGAYDTYESLVKSSQRNGHERLLQAVSRVLPHQIVNLQFTSGTTGIPKAAMLTHQ